MQVKERAGSEKKAVLTISISLTPLKPSPGDRMNGEGASLMRTKKSKPVFVTRCYINILFAIIVSLTALIPQAGAEPPLPAYEDNHLGIAFPRTLAGLTFGGLTKYDQATLGYCLRYGGRDLLKADLFVYDHGILNIPDGYDNETVKSEIAYAFLALEIMQERGQYMGLAHLATGVVPEQGYIRFIWGKHRYAEAPREGNLYTGPRISETFLTGFRGKFIKIRLTYKEYNLEEGKKTSDALTRALIELMMSAKLP